MITSRFIWFINKCMALSKFSILKILFKLQPRLYKDVCDAGASNMVGRGATTEAHS